MSTPKTTGTPVSSATRGDTVGTRTGHVVEVRGVAPDHRTEADDGVDRPRPGEPLRDERDLERAREPSGPGTSASVDAALLELVASAPVEQRLGDVVVEPPGDDRDPHAPAVELAFGRRVLPHLLQLPPSCSSSRSSR